MFFDEIKNLKVTGKLIKFYIFRKFLKQKIIPQFCCFSSLSNLRSEKNHEGVDKVNYDPLQTNINPEVSNSPDPLNGHDTIFFIWLDLESQSRELNNLVLIVEKKIN